MEDTKEAGSSRSIFQNNTAGALGEPVIYTSPVQVQTMQNSSAASQFLRHHWLLLLPWARIYCIRLLAGSREEGRGHEWIPFQYDPSSNLKPSHSPPSQTSSTSHQCLLGIHAFTQRPQRNTSYSILWTRKISSLLLFISLPSFGPCYTAHSTSLDPSSQPLFTQTLKAVFTFPFSSSDWPSLSDFYRSSLYLSVTEHDT